MRKIIHFVQIKAPPAEVYRALTTPEGLAGWWSRQVHVEPGVGGIVRFRFVEVFNPEMEVTRLEEDRRVEWRCVGGHESWQDDTFSFDLREGDGGTGVMFVQEYSRELPDEVYGNYNFNWGYYLGSLKQLCETGTGTPFEPS